MGEDEMRQFAMDFRNGLIGEGTPGDGFCFMVSAPLSSLLRAYGVECEMVMADLPDDDSHAAANHCWIALSDGRVLDPTFDQFCSEEPVAVYLGPPTEFHPSREAAQ